MLGLGTQGIQSASAERDDAPDRIVGRHTHGHTVSGNDFDSEAAHTAAQLRENFVALVALHAVQPAAVNGDDRPLHINQIILAQ
jgi:hypothetical protein